MTYDELIRRLHPATRAHWPSSVFPYQFSWGFLWRAP